MSDILMGHMRLIVGAFIELNQCDAKKAAFSWQPFRTATNTPTPWVLKWSRNVGGPRTKSRVSLPQANSASEISRASRARNGASRSAWCRHLPTEDE